MKSKALHTLVFLFIISSVAISQSTVNYGMKLGIVAGNQTWDYAFPTDFSTGTHWGIDVGTFLEPIQIPPFKLTTEVHYVQKGTSYMVTETFRTNNEQGYEDRLMTYRLRADYLTLAIMGGAKSQLYVVQPYFLAGPRFDFLLGNHDDRVDGMYDGFKTTDVGVTLAVGIEMPAAPMSSFLVELRFSPGFSNISTRKNLVIKNHSVEFLIGAGF